MSKVSKGAKLALKRAAAKARRKLRDGRDLTADEREMLAQWEQIRSPSGRRSTVMLAADPEDDEADPDATDTVPDEVPAEGTGPVDVIQDAPEPLQAAPAKRGKPPRVLGTKASTENEAKGHWRDKYEHGGAGGDREKICRATVDLANRSLIVPMIEFHKACGAETPLGKEHFVPTGSGKDEVRPPTYDDGVCAADDLLPAGLSMPAGFLFAFSVGMLCWSTWKLHRAVKAAGGHIPNTAAPKSPAATEPDGEDVAGEPFMAPEPTPTNGVPVPQDGRAF